MIDKKFAPIAQNLVTALQQLMGSIQPFIQAMAQISKAIAPYVEAMAPYIKEFVRYEKFIDSVRATGWLPYHTLSIDYVEKCAEDTALLENHISTFYKDNWNNIRQDIESRIGQYHISEETKKHFVKLFLPMKSAILDACAVCYFPQLKENFAFTFSKTEPVAFLRKKCWRN